MFKQASKMKLRFATSKGNLSVGLEPASIG